MGAKTVIVKLTYDDTVQDLRNIIDERRGKLFMPDSQKLSNEIVVFSLLIDPSSHSSSKLDCYDWKEILKPSPRG